MESVSSWVGGEFLLDAPCLNLSGHTSGGESILHARVGNCLVVGRVGYLSYTPRASIVSSFGGWDVSSTSRAGTCLRRSAGGESLNTPRARDCQIFRRVGRLCFHLCTGIYLTGRWVDNLC